MSISTDISSLTATPDPYTVKASLKDDQVDTSTSVATGDRTTDLFSSKNELGKDDFLLLLVTQLRFQDPLNPMENTEFVSQLAQFRSMESSSNIESAIKNLDESFQGTVKAQNYAAQSITNTSAVSLIGKQVRLRQTDVDWVASAGNSVKLDVNLGNNDTAQLQIKDPDGNIIKTINVEKGSDSSELKVVWDGTDDKGNVAKTGTYEIHFENEENDSSVYAFVQNTVSGIRYTAEGAMVKVGDKELSVGKILDVAGGSGSEYDTGYNGSSNVISLIGKNVKVKSDSITFNQGNGEFASAKIDTGGASNVKVDIVDSLGKTVWTEQCYADNDGVATLSWNGETLSGTYADAGKYKLKIGGQDDNPYLFSFVEGRVDGVTDVGSGIKLKVNGVYVNVSDIIGISA
jgi:flagellar basal-body rod modification protein FlgD